MKFLYGCSLVILAAQTVQAACALKINGNGEYEVASYVDLKQVGVGDCPESKTDVYRLTANIDASPSATENCNSAGICNGFTPIGKNRDTSFAAAFHGGGHVIRNLYINNYVFAGLFGAIGLSGVVDSLGIVSGSVRQEGESTVYAGALVGFNDGFVSACFATIPVTGYWDVGGLIGVNSNSVENSYATGNVTGVYHTGGLVGGNAGDVYRSYATGAVSGENGAGGLVGFNEVISSGGLYENSIDECYATGPVTGSEDVGGLVGFNKGIIARSYATGSVTGAKRGSVFVGGLVGYRKLATGAHISQTYFTGHVRAYSYWGAFSGHAYSWADDGPVSSSYWNEEAGDVEISDAVPLSTEAMQQASSFSGWSFNTSAWGIVAGESFPYLNGMLNAPFAISMTGATLPTKNWFTPAAGYYSDESATLIGLLTGYSRRNATGDSLYAEYRIAAVTSKDTLWGGVAYYKVPFDSKKAIDIPDYATLKKIGQDAHYPLFGSFRLIADIDASPSAGENCDAGCLGFLPIGDANEAFTGSFNGAGYAIHHLHIDREDEDTVGFFGVMGEGSRIDNLGLLDNDIRGRAIVGGFAAISHGTISSSYTTGKVVGDTLIGGLVALLDGGAIRESYSSGVVSLYSSYLMNINIGGLVGVAQHRASVTQSYFTGEVFTGHIIGESTFTGKTLGRGIVALVDDTSEVISTYCSAHFFKGAPFGPFVSPSKQLSNYYDSTVSGSFDYPDGEATALTTDAMKRSSVLSGLGDFSSGGVWVIWEDSTYPGLRSVDNAPFGFADVWHTNGTFSLSHFLENDYDVETRQQHLILHVDSLVGGTTDSTTELDLTWFTARVVYRVGEVRESHGDTLWGNRVESSLSSGDSTYEGLQNVRNHSPVLVHFISGGLDFRGIRGRVDVYDVRGNRVTSVLVLRDGFIDLSLSPGVYLVRSAGKNWMLRKQE